MAKLCNHNKALAAVVSSVLFTSVAVTGTPTADPLASARSALTGTHTREWVYTQIIVFMGPGNRCQQGEALQFIASTQQVVIESCVAGKMNSRSTSWTLRGNGPLDPILSFDGKDYLLTFHDEGNKHYMRLRQPGPSKIDETLDRQYRLSQD